MANLALIVLIAAAALPSAADADPGLARISKAQVDSLDAYFACAHAAMRSSQANGVSNQGFPAALSSTCAGEERELRRRSEALFAAKGIAPGHARARTDAAVDAARNDLIRVYSER